jgi:two-component system chemotaxis sensor kinase CheA
MMSDFQGMEDMLQDFLTEAGELLSDVDNKLVELERRPDDGKLLNDIFRSFHTVKGGAGFLGVTPLVDLCHLTENLFDLLRGRKLLLDAAVLDVILAATASVRDMFAGLGQGQQPGPADPALLARLEAALRGEAAGSAPVSVAPAAPAPAAGPAPVPAATATGGPDWEELYAALLGTPARAASGAAVPVADPVAQPAPATETRYGRRASDQPGAEGMPVGRRDGDRIAVSKDATIRIDTQRLDQVLNLSGEIGLARNRLNCLRRDILSGKKDGETLAALDQAVNQLDLLVSDLQNAAMKTRMQPIGRLFQKYPRMARDLARSLGKDVELALSGEETELDRVMIDQLSDPLVHLVRNAVDHGVEAPADRVAAGKPEKSTLRLSARQAGDHIVIEIADDGRGMSAEALRRKAVEKGLIEPDVAAGMDERHSLQLIFLPGFSTKDQISDVSGRGVGMDVVKNNIQKLNGRIEVQSRPGAGTTITISLPLTMAILPVLVLKHGAQSLAVPLALVHELVPIQPESVQLVGGRPVLAVRGEVLPVRTLAGLLGWEPTCAPRYGVLVQSALTSFVLAVEGYAGRDDVVIKPLTDLKPRGVAGASLTGDGSVVLVLDMEALLAAPANDPACSLLLEAAA